MGSMRWTIFVNILFLYCAWVRLGDFVVVITLYGERSVSVAGMMLNGCFCSTACLFASLLRDGCTVRTDQWDSTDENELQRQDAPWKSETHIHRHLHASLEYFSTCFGSSREIFKKWRWIFRKEKNVNKYFLQLLTTWRLWAAYNGFFSNYVDHNEETKSSHDLLSRRTDIIVHSRLNNGESSNVLFAVPGGAVRRLSVSYFLLDRSSARSSI